jgi:hypothetical protein
VELLQSGEHVSRLISLATMMHADRYNLSAINPEKHASSGYKSQRRDGQKGERRGKHGKKDETEGGRGEEHGEQKNPKGGGGERQRRHSEQYVRKREQNRGRKKDLKGTERNREEARRKTGKI